MTNEEIYDAEIAPALLKISQRCQELGFAMVASVEWEVGENGRTEFCPKTDGSTPRPSAKQLLVHYAARCHGNIDAMLMAVMRDAEKYGHTSAYLHNLGVKETPSLVNVRNLPRDEPGPAS
jgi:hypothetical protein